MCMYIWLNNKKYIISLGFRVTSQEQIVETYQTETVFTIPVKCLHKFPFVRCENLAGSVAPGCMLILILSEIIGLKIKQKVFHVPESISGITFPVGLLGEFRLPKYTCTIIQCTHTACRSTMERFGYALLHIALRMLSVF